MMPRIMEVDHSPENIFSSLSLMLPLLKEGLQSHRSDIRQQVSQAIERQLSLINLPTIVSQINPNFASNASGGKLSKHAPLTASASVNIAPRQPPKVQKEHRKLDRSASEPADKQQALWQISPSSSRYKTELCRPFEESGTCKYGDKCQFAHGIAELRSLSRHPKYKTELCRTFHSTGFCPYGPRCHFIHNSEEAKKYFLDSLQGGRGHSPPLSPVYQELELGVPPPVDYRYIRPGSEGDLSPHSSSCSSGSPTSSMGGFFLEEIHAAMHQEPPAPVVREMSYMPVKPLAQLPSLIPKSKTSEASGKTLEKLVSDIKDLGGSPSLPFGNAEGRPEPSAAVDINRNIRLPIFSKISCNSP